MLIVVAIGPGVPPAFAKWIKTPRRNISVTFGPRQSFVAWNEASVRWSDVPAELEESLQEWIYDKNKWGSLKFACLGQGNSFMAVTQSGGWSSGNLPQKLQSELSTYRFDQSVIAVSCGPRKNDTDEVNVV